MKDPSRKSKKEKRERKKNAAVGSARDYKYDTQRYDPESLDVANTQMDLNAKKKINQKQNGKNDDAGDDVDGVDGDAAKTKDSSFKSTLPLFHHDETDSNETIDPSKRYYQSKTNFWTDMYQSTKGRKDVVALKAASAEFRLTDLGLEEQYGLGIDAASSSSGGGGFQFGFEEEGDDNKDGKEEESRVEDSTAEEVAVADLVSKKANAVPQNVVCNYQLCHYTRL